MEILRPWVTAAKVGYTNTWLRKLEKEGRFPRRIRLGPNAVGHVKAEVEAWIAARAKERGAISGAKPEGAAAGDAAAP